MIVHTIRTGRRELAALSEDAITMSKTERKRYTGAFKAKVGLEALMGVKTVGQIAREYQVHPVQVTQWKGMIRK